MKKTGYARVHLVIRFTCSLCAETRKQVEVAEDPGSVTGAGERGWPGNWGVVKEKSPRGKLLTSTEVGLTETELVAHTASTYQRSWSLKPIQLWGCLSDH